MSSNLTDRTVRRSSEPGFTPGPWHAAETWRPPVGNFKVEDERKDANGNIFWGYSISGSNEHGGSILPTLAAVHNFPDQIHANARLIAAAPDLYTALEYMADLFKDWGGDQSTDHGWATDEMRDVWLKARAALAKVEGKP